MVKHGKNHLEALQAVDRNRNYSPDEAVDLAKETAKAKFDETLEIHLRTGSDPRHADQLIRGRSASAPRPWQGDTRSGFRLGRGRHGRPTGGRRSRR